jgi:hypothetical protein
LASSTRRSLVVKCLWLRRTASLTIPKPPFTDYRYEKSGTTHKIGVDDLPAPLATESTQNTPEIVDRKNSRPQAPAGFKVDLYATGLKNPRFLRVAPNGDIFVSEPLAGDIKNKTCAQRAAKSILPAEQPRERENSETEWRRGWDSNPRDPFRPNGFQDRRIQPLCHPSDAEIELRRASTRFRSAVVHYRWNRPGLERLTAKAAAKPQAHANCVVHPLGRLAPIGVYYFPRCASTTTIGMFPCRSERERMARTYQSGPPTARTEKRRVGKTDDCRGPGAAD